MYENEDNSNNEPGRDLKPWSPKQLSPKHLRVIHLHSTGLFSGKEISELLDISQSRISVIVNDPRAQELVAEYQRKAIAETTVEAEEVIKASSVEAAKTVVQLMRNAASERIRQTSAFGILDRSGIHGKGNGNGTGPEGGKLDPESAKLIAEALRETREPVQALEMVEDTAGVFTAMEKENKRNRSDKA